MKKSTHPILKSALAILVGSIIFIGLPLLGWGSNGSDDFFHHPARSVYVVLMIFLQFFSVVYLPHNKEIKKEKKDFKHKVDLILIQIFSLAIVFVAPYMDHHSILRLSSNTIFRYAGLILLTSGFLLMQLAEKYLDKQFSVQVTIREEHRLVTNGPYKHIRHPRYLGIILFFTGISFVFQSVIALTIVFVLAIVLVWRIFAEESLMQQTFGQQWDEYCSTSWRVLPYLF